MNIVLLNFLLIIAGIGLISVIFARLAPKSWTKHLYSVSSWLIEISFLFFVNFLIFLKPWKKHLERIGVYTWLILVFIVGRYLIVEQPLITDIQPQFLPFIGYIYLVSVLYLIKFSVELIVKKENLVN